MEVIPWIDLHCHCRQRPSWQCREEYRQVYNFLCSTDCEKIDPEAGLWFSAGIHPRDFEKAHWEQLAFCLDHEACIAVGECGMDRFVSKDLREQRQVFIRQAEMAAERKKPLIVHGVRVHEELLLLRRDFPEEQPWICHGFRGNERKTMRMIEGGFYLSFGQGLLKDAANMESFFYKIPQSRIFCETDESGEDIRKIYAQAASLLQCSEPEFRLTVRKNFERCFHQ